VDRKTVHALEENRRVDQLCAERLLRKVSIALAIGSELGENEVVRIQAERDRRGRTGDPRRDVDDDEPLFPPCRCLRGFGPDGVRVIPVGLLEVRTVAKGAFDLDRLLGRVAR
jgi:hypothetical protein